jgi:hypothetical protein
LGKVLDVSRRLTDDSDRGVGDGEVFILLERVGQSGETVVDQSGQVG